MGLIRGSPNKALDNMFCNFSVLDIKVAGR